MHLTSEQKAIVKSSGDIKINAVAGSGKTTVLIEYAKAQKSARRILYLAFNRSVRLEAQRRFAEQGVANVEVQTAHSLAYRHVVIPNGYQVASGYKNHEIVRLLRIQPAGRDPHSAHIIAGHILKLCSLFCNSVKAKVTELDYYSTLSDEHALHAVERYHEQIEKGARQLLAMMDRKDIPVTHDFYLKKYQLSHPQLRHDVILFDEGQDASPVMLDVFLSQAGRKVIVGDVHQQIYGWRHAINALRKVNFTNYNLGTSFRFNAHIARLAMQCLSWKKLLGESDQVTIEGVGTNAKVKSRATIARTNLALLKSAIDTVQHDRTVKKLYFEGNLNSYTYAGDGASIYDVLNLYLDRKEYIRDPLIGSMSGFAQLEEYAEESDDADLGMLIGIVREYGGEIPSLLKKITAMHVTDEQRENADMIFSTVHRCKGMEYDSVCLADDFITAARIQKLLEKEQEEPVDRDRLAEEINLAYVAVTRSRNFLDFPDEMFPGTDKSVFAEKRKKRAASKVQALPKTGGGAGSRQKFAKAYTPWSLNQDEELVIMYRSGMPVKKIAQLFERNPGAIWTRLRKLGIEE
jgi:superfamily I DNA/RNA helicase